MVRHVPLNAHHLRFAQPSALGRRVSDEFTVPLSRSHHRARHCRATKPSGGKRIGLIQSALRRNSGENPSWADGCQGFRPPPTGLTVVRTLFGDVMRCDT
jgi:hypothetical protein